MTLLDNIPASFSNEEIAILDNHIPVSEYILIDLSENNEKLKNIIISDYLRCQKYIDTVLNNNSGTVAYGGYLEKRNLYKGNPDFENDKLTRNVHLGMDFWATIGTKVVTPIDGKVHSFKNNSNHGDYGPTIILEHVINSLKYYTLYGHLSIESLDGLYTGKPFKKGEALATLGAPEINMGYAPHLHFQIIKDLHGNHGDYPGVCSEKDMQFFSQNCPDPNLLFNLPLIMG